MEKRFQNFVAPGEDQAPLPLEPSPWHDMRLVTVPREHWELILQLGVSVDAAKAKQLDGYSLAADYNAECFVHAAYEELETVVEFMRDLARRIEVAAPLVPQATEEVPDELENEEHVRMLQAVIAVFEEAIRQSQPFRAWID